MSISKLIPCLICITSQGFFKSDKLDHYFFKIKIGALFTPTQSNIHSHSNSGFLLFLHLHFQVDEPSEG